MIIPLILGQTLTATEFLVIKNKINSARLNQNATTIAIEEILGT